VGLEGQDQKLLAAITKRVQGLPVGQQKGILAAITGNTAAAGRQQLFAEGKSLEEQFLSQLNAAGINKNVASYAVGGGAKPPTGGIGGIFRRLLGAGGGGVTGSLIGGVASALGVGVGGYALVNAGQALIEADKQATAYERQMKAASALAGGQEKLNNLLKEYNKDSGGAVSKTDQLAAVTRLLATGFAKTTTELGRVTRGVRGASIALGRPQEEVTQDVQLAISNTSKKRLDQIGLGIKEVDDRIEQLRKNNKGWVREQAFGEAVLQLLDEKYGKLSKTLEGQATGLEKLAAAWDDLFLAMGKNSKSPINQFLGGIADILEKMSAPPEAPKKGGFETLPFGLGNLISRSPNWLKSGLLGSEFTPRMLGKNNAFGKFFDPFTARLAGFGNDYGAYNASLLLSGALGAGAGSQTRYHGGSPTGPGPVQPRFSQAQYDVIGQAYDAIAATEKQFNRPREDENRNFNQSMASMEKNYNKSRLREAEDYERSRARGLRDYNKSVSDAIADASDRDTQAQDELNKSIGKMQRDSNLSLAKNERDFREQEERANKQHRLAMLKSAGQLDAVALLDERLSANEDRKQRKKDHEQQVQDAKDALALQIQDAKDAAKDRLDQAHKEDKKRLEDMAFNYKQQQDDADADRAIALARAKEDHDDEIAEAKRVHDEKMTQIDTEEQDRITELNDALQKDLTAVGIYVKGYQEKLEARDKKMEEWFDKYLDKMEKTIGIENQIPKGENSTKLGPSIPQYASGGYVPKTGIAMLHAGEFVMPRALVASNSSHSSSSKVVEIHAGAFQVTTTPGMEMMVGKMIEDMSIDALEAA
jgi:hypothetical protein